MTLFNEFYDSIYNPIKEAEDAKEKLLNAAKYTMNKLNDTGNIHTIKPQGSLSESGVVVTFIYEKGDLKVPMQVEIYDVGGKYSANVAISDLSSNTRKISKYATKFLPAKVEALLKNTDTIRDEDGKDTKPAKLFTKLVQKNFNALLVGSGVDKTSGFSKYKDKYVSGPVAFDEIDNEINKLIGSTVDILGDTADGVTEWKKILKSNGLTPTSKEIDVLKLDNEEEEEIKDGDYDQIDPSKSVGDFTDKELDAMDKAAVRAAKKKEAKK